MRASSVWAKVARRVAQLRSDYAVALLDLALTTAAFIIALTVRFDGQVSDKYWTKFWQSLPVILAAMVVLNLVFGLYGKLWRHASIYEARRLAAAGSVLLLVLFAFNALERPLPNSVILNGSLLSVALMGLVRFQARLFSFRRRDLEAGLRVVVIGSRDRAAAAIRQMKNHPKSGLRPIAILDDDRDVTGWSLVDVPVVGTVDDLEAVVQRHNIQLAVIAVSDPSSELLERAASGAERAGIALKILPEINETMSTGVAIRDLRDLHIEDLLGRDQVAIDLTQVHGMLAGQTVLVTGAGGSIGSEIARQVLQAAPQRVLLLDHDETHLHDLAAGLTGPFDLLLADIRNQTQVDAIFAEYHPTIVFHAAAHKHVPLLEQHPAEAAHTNVLGTSNLVNAARAVDVDRFVLISTDKAVRPSSVMGASKRLCEQIILARAPRHSGYCAVRFGNVLGSRGSVVPTFMKQLDAGGPITVTDPRMTRYFMSIHEAVQLVLQAAAMAGSSAGTERGGEVFMLDMGQPVKIIELAERMIRLSGRIPGKDVEIRITGVRPGEKLDEELSTEDEDPTSTAHPSISLVSPVQLEPAELESGVVMLEHYVAELNHARCAQVLHRLAGSSTVPNA